MFPTTRLLVRTSHRWIFLASLSSTSSSSLSSSSSSSLLFRSISPFTSPRLSIFTSSFVGCNPSPPPPPPNDDRRSPVPALVESLTDELREKIVQPNISFRFRLEALIDTLKRIHLMKYPLPDELSLEQWEALIQLQTPSGIFTLVDFIVTGSEDDKRSFDEVLNELKETEKVDLGPYTVPPSMAEELAEELKDDMTPEKFQLRIQKLELHHAHLREAGWPVPPRIKKKHLKTLLLYYGHSDGARKNYLRFLHDICILDHCDWVKKRAADIRNPEIIRRRKEDLLAEEAKGKIIYGLGFNAIFLRLDNLRKDIQLNWYPMREFYSDWGTPLVIDLAFFKEMSIKEAMNLLHVQLTLAISYNRNAKAHYALYLVNFDPKCRICRLLKDNFPYLFEDSYPIHITEKSYLDLFPKERLLYLSPDSRNDLMEYDPQDIYIIGAIVDKGIGKPLTLGSAKSEGIRHAKLPLKRFVGLTRELNVDHMVAIMCDYKATRDWFYSLRWIPTRNYLNRLKIKGLDTNSKTKMQMELIFLAMSKLKPKYAGDHSLSPAEYRQIFNEMVAQGGISTENMTPWKSPPPVEPGYKYKDSLRSNSKFKKRTTSESGPRLSTKDFKRVFDDN